MTRVVEVRTGARLHFGLFTTSPGDGPFGGIGVMIDRPGLGFVAEVIDRDRDDLSGPHDTVERISRFLSSLRAGVSPHSGLESFRVRIKVASAIPPHRGFGSGTQTALAVAATLQQFCTFAPFIPLEPLGRAGRSAVGASGFFRGGFVVDLPQSAYAAERKREVWIDSDDFHYPGVLHHRVPDAWRFVIVDPRTAVGLSGEDERAAFETLPVMRPVVTRRLEELASRDLRSALERHAFQDFAAGVAEFNRLVGEQFGPVQGGVYAHPLVRELSRTLADTDWPHLAQSSWGPAAAVFCHDETSAEDLRAFLAKRIGPAEADIFVAAPRNTGAEVRLIDDAK